ncbi:signal recognition particle-docking protein FtsY [Methylobacterium sp. NEAU 140]|uniref:signal recognition particle-docking protein FtsY n=1 Tax=Methylobacterium sp. NEAU 140 TaxID=3064945 RepID=UPI0027340A47|nr:signal recognition particle-docking protein FtsY [Methylobacterium sp. NEAU 140]MDP4023922.1 signal recognition particle-docking protein FtsY [Methylobacterium sp. NEAU 140]
MASEDKPGWFGRLFGRKGQGAPQDAPEEEADATPEDAPSAVDPASPSEGQPDFATGADDITAVPLDEAPTPDAVEGADMLPVEGEPERPPAGTAGDAPERGAEPQHTGAQVREPALAPDIQPTDSAAALAHDAGAGPAREPEAKGWWSRLTSGMRRTSTALSDRVTGLFTKRKLDATTLEDLEDALIQADFGLDTAMRVSEAVGKGRYEKGISPDEVRAILAAEVERALEPVAQPLAIDEARKPFVILTVGVNGAGKTTTLGKLASKLRAEGRTVMLAAGDTFRAAAIDQLKVWGARTGTPVVSGAQGADAAGLAFDALKQAEGAGTDVLLIDTAGRLQNKVGLMAELEKIVRVLRKQDPEAPHATLLVLDATVGQNALSQVELFSQAAPISGLVMTKLDGTARGGILVALAAKFGLPVHFIGVGEGVEDLEPFAARDFARAIAGLERD